MKILDFEQYSDKWWEARIGLPTASMFDKLVTSKCQKSTSFKAQAFKIAAEIEMGKVEQGFTNDWMQRGHDLEAEARDTYSFLQNVPVNEVGFVVNRGAGCSPDGLGAGGLEIKCPSAGVHMQYKYENKLPVKYRPQVYGSLWICDTVDYWDFMSYHPDMKPFITRVTRDESYQKYAAALDKYIPEFNELVKKIGDQ